LLPTILRFHPGIREGEKQTLENTQLTEFLGRIRNAYLQTKEGERILFHHDVCLNMILTAHGLHYFTQFKMFQVTAYLLQEMSHP
jgi:hypothetical protein